MATRMWIVCVLIMLIAGDVHVTGGLATDKVPFTPVANATEKRAVCIDGSPSGYGDGAKNWLLYLMGGGWCPDNSWCQNSSTIYLGSTKDATTNPMEFNGILSQHQDTNPDFYNWNRIYVHYCDQSSFLGDTEIVGQGPELQFRGSRIFDAVIDDAHNAILAGRSAGGLATILHCDKFRARASSTGRVKCISDSGFFIHGKDLPNVGLREHLFASTISFHNISSFLPKSCTEKIDPSLCFFPEYLVGGVQTTLFILNSAFDYYEFRFNLFPQNTSDSTRWEMCWGSNFKNCSANDKELLKEYKRTFLRELEEIPDIPSRGLFIHTCFTHSVSDSKQYWNLSSSLNMENMTMVQAVGNWYFD